MNWFGVLLAIAGVAIIWIVATFNKGVRLQQTVRESRANIDVQLKRRHELIPQLVAVVKSYANHEQGIFVAIAEARAKASASLNDVKSGYEDESELIHAVNKMMAVVEGYPELKADQHFAALQKELANTEDRIAAARRFYNANCRAWNVFREAFPSSMLVSGPPAYYFEVEGLEVAPSV